MTDIDFSKMPVNVDRKSGAKLLTQYMFPVSPRTLEAWPLTWLHVNGKAICTTVELFTVAQAKIDGAPPIRNVRTRP